MENELLNLVERLLDCGEQMALFEPRDRIYLRNQYYDLFDLTPLKSYPEISRQELHTPAEYASLILDKLTEYTRNKLGETEEQQICKIIHIMLPPPSSIENKFNRIKSTDGIINALNWYYNFSCNSDYIKIAAVKRNKSWTSESTYGNLEITINLSKPEKDPKEIAKLKSQPKSDSAYPQCLLCIENEGFAGTGSKPARHNHRILEMDLNQQKWYFQFSPYAYYPEHSIIINKNHKPMLIDQNTINALFDFVDQIPHYLIGSNSDIPIVGGSILNHDHFQAGNYIFPIEKSTMKFSRKIDNIQIEYLNWPVSTLRLNGKRSELQILTAKIIKEWYHFSMPELDIIAFSDKGVRHNAITPVLRKINTNNYQLYLMLRNNRTNSSYPDGIFHPHESLHHIKKENIGLIEAMGLAILPGRLDYELEEMSRFLEMNDKDLALIELLYDEQMLKHENWLTELYTKYTDFSNQNLIDILRNEVGNKFCQVLEDAGVFKQNEAGDQGVTRFLDGLV
ncbi:MAG: UDP-glucose--hexose-1-phosphate uridylyltransferase [Neisseriales bacterium]|nr:MAG: UDP-glucose--hexose-1-phosphate uridylyltransferase [Neisseriales bacterium]